MLGSSKVRETSKVRGIYSWISYILAFGKLVQCMYSGAEGVGHYSSVYPTKMCGFSYPI